MYIPKHFEQPSIETMRELMRARPLATLVTVASGGLEANHIPLYHMRAHAVRRAVRPCGACQSAVARFCKRH